MNIDEYEFRRSENKIIGRFASAMLLFAIIAGLSGVVLIIQAIIHDFSLTGLIAGLTWLIMGVVFYFPTDNFGKVVETEGNDIAELMTGFSEMKTGWIIFIIVFAINRLAILLDLFGIIG